jgi:transposase
MYAIFLYFSNNYEEYGIELVEVTEEYTSKNCTNCGMQSALYTKDRIKNNFRNNSLINNNF